MLCWENPLIYCKRSGSLRKGEQGPEQFLRSSHSLSLFPGTFSMRWGRGGVGPCGAGASGLPCSPCCSLSGDLAAHGGCPLGKLAAKANQPFVAGNFRGEQVGQQPRCSSPCLGCGSQHTLTVPGYPSLGSMVGENIRPSPERTRDCRQLSVPVEVGVLSWWVSVFRVAWLKQLLCDRE